MCVFAYTCMCVACVHVRLCVCVCAYVYVCKCLSLCECVYTCEGDSLGRLTISCFLSVWSGDSLGSLRMTISVLPYSQQRARLQWALPMYLYMNILDITPYPLLILYWQQRSVISPFPGFTRALVLRPIRKCFPIGLSTSAGVKPGNEARVLCFPVHMQCI